VVINFQHIWDHFTITTFTLLRSGMVLVQRSAPDPVTAANARNG